MNVLRFRLWWILPMGIILASVVAATAATAAQRASDKPPLKIGVNLSLTGPFAVLGQSVKNGLVLAARQANAKGGANGRKVELKILDDGSSPANTITNINRLISDGVTAIVGFSAGQTQVPAAGVLARQDILTLAVSGYNPGQPTGPNYFWIPPTIGGHIEAVSCWITKVAKPRRVAIIGTSDAGSQLVVSGVKEQLSAAGIQVVAVETVPAGASDVTVSVAKVRDAAPDFIVDAAVGGTGGLVAKTVRSLNIKVPMIGWLAWGILAVLKLHGGTIDGVIHPGVIAPNDPTQFQEVFARTYQRNYGGPPEPYAPWGFDAVNLIVEAVKKVPNATQKDGPKLAKALESMRYQGVATLYRFGKYNEATAPALHTGINKFLWLRVKGQELARIARQPKACT